MENITDINWLYHKYYNDNPLLKRIVYIHSLQVARKALKILVDKGLPLDPKDVYSAAMLHDIGVVKCNATDIHAMGQLPYILHGIEGSKILIENGLHQFADICMTHTGAGISIEEIISNHLPLPHIDMIPDTLLEKLICYADKFYSKSHDLKREKPLEEVVNQIKKFGSGSLNRFKEMHKIFGEQDIII